MIVEERARRFCQQWRHAYLLLTLMFGWTVIFGRLLIPELESIRVEGGLHPIEVLGLLHLLGVMWVPLWVAIGLYALSYWVKPLNTSAGVAWTALGSSFVFFLLAATALLRVWLSSL